MQRNFLEGGLVILPRGCVLVFARNIFCRTDAAILCYQREQWLNNVNGLFPYASLLILSSFAACIFSPGFLYWAAYRRQLGYPSCEVFLKSWAFYKDDRKTLACGCSFRLPLELVFVYFVCSFFIFVKFTKCSTACLTKWRIFVTGYLILAMVRYYNNCAIPRTGCQSECKFSQNGAQFEVPEEFTQNIPKKTLPPPEINVAHMLEYDRMIILFEFLEVLIRSICYTFNLKSFKVLLILIILSNSTGNMTRNGSFRWEKAGPKLLMLFNPGF